MGVYVLIAVGVVVLVAGVFIFMRLERAQRERIKRQRGKPWPVRGDSGAPWDGGGFGGFGG
jgi:hypothetical protein